MDRKPDRGKRDGRASGRLKPVTLERAALHYLERFSASEAGLRATLDRRIARAARDGRCDAEEAAAWVDPIVAKLKRLGYIDDARFAESRVRNLRARGDSTRTVRAKLAAKGVQSELVDRVLHAHDARLQGGAELAAAARLVRRRRLGPMRPSEERRDRRQRDLAALARAGFSVDVATRVIDLPDAAALEMLLADL